MKKFLSLVLALVMTMSLVTISAGAKDFDDNADITYVEAVDVMSEIGIVDGDKSGNFNPTNGLTRGAAAKIICNLILGPTTAAELNADTNPYPDVAQDSTFGGYIAYCQKEGIISGYADGTFKPANPLTGYAFMKMLLGALGYDAEIEQYVGANWSINVAKQAIGIGLDDGLKTDFNGSDFVTREEAMLYAFNTLKATMVEYKNSSTIVVGDITVQTNSTATEVEQAGRYDTIEANLRTEFAEKYFTKLKLTETEHDDFMRPAHEWKYGKTEIGTYTNDADATYTASVKGKEVYADLGAAYDFEEVEGEVAFFVDGAQVDARDGDEDELLFDVVKNNNESIGANGVLTEVYVMDGGDDDDTIRVVQVNTYVAIAEEDYDDEDEVIDISIYNEQLDEATLELDDWAIIEDLKEDDVLLVTISFIGEEPAIKSVELAETFTEAVTNYESNYNVETNFEPKDTVTAGEKYSYDANFATSIEGFNGSYIIKDEYDFYLDNYGYVIFVEGIVAADQYVYIDAFEASGISSKATLKGYAYFVDGTSELINVKSIEDETIKGAEAIATAMAELFGEVANGLFTYTEKNGKYDLEIAVTNETNMAPAVELEVGELTATDALDLVEDEIGGTIRGSKNTVFIIINEDDEVELYTGIKNVPVITIAEADEEDELAYIAVTDDDSDLYVEYVFIDLGTVGSTSGRAKGGDVMFLYEDTYSKKGEDSDENVYHTYKVIKDGEKTTVKFDAECNDLVAGLYIGVKYDENGYACDYTYVDGTDYDINDPDVEDYTYGRYTEATAEVKGDVLTLWKGETYAAVPYYMTDDCDVTFIVDEDTKNVSWKKINGEDYVVNGGIWGVMNSDNEFTKLFIQLSEVE